MVSVFYVGVVLCWRCVVMLMCVYLLMCWCCCYVLTCGKPDAYLAVTSVANIGADRLDIDLEKVRGYRMLFDSVGPTGVTLSVGYVGGGALPFLKIRCGWQPELTTKFL